MAERRDYGIKDGSLIQIPFLWEQFSDDVKKLHQDGPAVDCIPHEERNSGLLKACLIGHRVNVQLFFRWGAAIECRDEQGNTPLLISANKGFTDIVDFLLKNGADVNASNSAGDTPLILSIRSPGSLETMERILEHELVEIEQANNAGYTALMTAIEEFDLKAVKVLLDANACLDREVKASWEQRDLCVTEDANGSDEPMKTVLTARTLVEALGLGTIMDYLKSKESPLKTAVLNGDFNSVCLLLDSQVSYINYQSPNREIVSYFLKSCEGNSRNGTDDNDIAIVQKLLDSTQHYNFDHQSALILASENGYADIVQLLLLNYPDQYEKSYFKNNCREALERAFILKRTECEKKLFPFLTVSKRQLITILFDVIHSRRLDFLKLLSDYHPRIRQLVRDLNKYHRNILIFAVETGNLETVSLLLDWAADVNLETYNGKTALTSAKNSEMVNLLIHRGANVNQITGKNRTSPLLVLSQRKTPHIFVKMLLEAGADVRYCDQNGNSALHFAVRSRSLGNVKALVCHHADVNAATKTGSTPLKDALILEEVEIVTYLIENGADVNVLDKQGRSLIFFALSESSRDNRFSSIEKGDFSYIEEDLYSLNTEDFLLFRKRPSKAELLQIVLKNGADVNAGTWIGGNVLKRILSKKYLTYDDCTCIELLLFYGADPRVIDPIVVHQLIESGHESLVKILTCRGLPPTDMCNGSGIIESPLSLAVSTFQLKLATYFIDKWYLTQSDLVSLRHDFRLRKTMNRVVCPKSLHDLSFQPYSLQLLSFMVISLALGTSHDRVSKVQTLSLPVELKEKLSYTSRVKEPVVKYGYESGPPQFSILNFNS